MSRVDVKKSVLKIIELGFVILVIVDLFYVTDAQTVPHLRRIAEFPGFHRGSFAPDGTRIALVNDAKIKIVSSPAGRTICEVQVPSKTALEPEFDSVAFSADGRTLA